MSLTTLIVWGVVVVIVSVIDYVVPMYFTKLTGGSKYAERGAMIGLVADHSLCLLISSICKIITVK